MNDEHTEGSAVVPGEEVNHVLLGVDVVRLGDHFGLLAPLLQELRLGYKRPVRVVHPSLQRLNISPSRNGCNTMA